MANEYSASWFETFLSPDASAPVDREVGFITQHLPLDRFGRVLDLGCGIGRHGNALAALGYDVLGIDRSEPAIRWAREVAPPRAEYRVHDLLRVDQLEGPFDVILSLWQSFGFGDEDENLRLLQAVGSQLRQGGRFLLDVYNARALDQLPASEITERNGRTIRTTRRRAGSRFHVEIRYDDTVDVDRFDWHVYSQEELTETAESAGLGLVLACAWFDPDTAPSRDHLRMQLLFERADGGT